MTDRKLMQDIREAKRKRPIPVLGLFVAILSITHGEFIYRVDGYFLAHTEPYLSMLPEDVIGILLIALGVLKIIGIVFKSYWLKRVGIVGISATWAGLSLVSFTYSFGTGFPHPSWQFMFFVTAICLLESRRGDYGY